MNMNFIEEIDGLREAGRKYKTECILGCCKGRMSHTKNHIFRYSDNIGVKYIPKIRRYKTANPIECYNKDYELVGSYSTIFRASLETGVSRYKIRNSLVNNIDYKNIFFKYKNT